MSNKTIHVVLSEFEQTYEATGWHVDEFGHLHLLGEKGDGNVATFRAGAWVSVSAARVRK